MAKHRIYAGVLHENGAGASDGALRIQEFIPFSTNTPAKSYQAEFRLGASFPWQTATKTGNSFSIIMPTPGATGGADVSVDCEVRLNGGADGQWLLFRCTILSWENAPRELDVFTGQEKPMNASFFSDVFPSPSLRLAASVYKKNNYPLTAYPLNVGENGQPLAGADDTNPATNGGKQKTFSPPAEPTSSLEINRNGTGTSGTSALMSFTDILTDSTLTEGAPDFAVVETIVNPSSNGATDGSITLSITGGTGSFSFLWADNGATTQNRTGLAGGVYEVQITDVGNPTNVQTFFYNVVDPAEPTDFYGDSVLESSPINPIRFKNNEGAIDNVSVLNNADNTNYCENSPEGWNTPPSYEIFNVADVTRIQFKTDFEINTLNVKGLDDVTVGTLPLEVKVDNINNNTIIAGYIRSNGAGTIRAYPNSLQNPGGTKVGDTVGIESTLGTYNGLYEIIDILTDFGGQVEYLVLAATYTVDENCAIQYLNPLRYNIVEAAIDMAALGIGVWKLQLVGGDIATGKNLVSEWIKVQAQTPNMFVLNYRNFDNAYRVDWSTEIEMKLRVFGMFTSSKPTRDVSIHRDSNDVPQVLNSYVRRKREAMFLELPWYAVERLALILSCDYFSVNGVEYFAEELPEGETPPRYSLTKMTAMLEQKNWINEQNTHDGGDTSDSEISVIGGEGIDVLGI